MQTFYTAMETRVLTLFDDEDFFPQEEPPKKMAKKTAPGNTPVSGTGAETTEQALFAPEPEPVIAIAAAPIEQENTSSTELEALPEQENMPLAEQMETVMESEAAVREEVGEETEEEEPATNSPAPPAIHLEFPPAEDELGKQLLQELILQDYTALIHKDYPFDIQQASVVPKEKPAKAVTPVATTEALPVHEEDEVFEEVVPLPEWNLDKKYYTIGEVAQLFAVNTSHIRFWTNEFKLKPRTTRKGDRLYNPKDIAELRLIHHLVKEKKHTIKGAREKLKVEKTGVNQKLDLKESLTGLRDMLLQIKEQL